MNQISFSKFWEKASTMSREGFRASFWRFLTKASSSSRLYLHNPTKWEVKNGPALIYIIPLYCVIEESYSDLKLYCSDFKIVNMLAGLNGSWCSMPCIVCLWESRNNVIVHLEQVGEWRKRVRTLFLLYA